jgi:hypothetical protein
MTAQRKIMSNSVSNKNHPGERESPRLCTQALSWIHPPAPEVLNINCWVLGDPPHQVFSVDISRGVKASDLKELIKNKKKPAFNCLSADTLELWEVSKHV